MKERINVDPWLSCKVSKYVDTVLGHVYSAFFYLKYEVGTKGADYTQL